MWGRHRLLRRFGLIVVGAVTVAIVVGRRHRRRAAQPVASGAVTDASDEPIETVAAVDDAPTEQTVTYFAASEARVEPEREPAAPALDLEQITRDLEGVAMALARLDDGTYWTDEVTGEPLAEELLAADPVARRNR
jgi:hypothetical protein